MITGKIIDILIVSYRTLTHHVQLRLSGYVAYVLVKKKKDITVVLNGTI